MIVAAGALMKIIKDIRPPSGFVRLLFRVPIALYRLRLGWLFGHRLLLLNHVGRTTGNPRTAVLEVVQHNAVDGTYVVASGWGHAAAWYRNVMRTPEVTIQVGTRTIPVTAVPLPAPEGAEIFARYAARHRRTATHVLPRLMGFQVDGSEADFRAVGQRMPFVRFVPRTSGSSR
jgi:deazaflavin-dependent oxidoreductase (nitroreductase family)